MRSALVRRSRRGAEAWRACSRWEPHSYGYHGDDGKKFHNHGQGHDYGPTYSTGDVIGAGVHLERQEIFFTCAPSRRIHAGCRCSFCLSHGIHRCMHVRLAPRPVHAGSRSSFYQSS